MRASKHMSKDAYKALQDYYKNKKDFSIEFAAKQSGLAVRTVKKIEKKVMSQTYEEYYAPLRKNGKTDKQNIEFITQNLGKLTINEIGNALGFERNTVQHLIHLHKIDTNGVPSFCEIMRARKLAERAAIIEQKKTEKEKEKVRISQDRTLRMVAEVKRKELEQKRMANILEVLSKSTNEKMRIVIGRDTYYLSPQKYDSMEKIASFISKKEREQYETEKRFNKWA